VAKHSKDQLKLGVFFNHTGHHVASWRHPDAQADAGVNLRHYIEMARGAENAKLDFVFFADQLAVRSAELEALSCFAQYTAHFEPLTLLSALAVATKRIGLIATATTSYNEPYHVARKFASLDHISNGRAGWNVVTSSEAAEALNFGRDAHYGHSERYQIAREFVEVVRGLWDSWDDDAFVRDKKSGRYFDPSGLHILDHAGKNFKVRGPLNVPRPPQGYPVIVQAGSSDEGRDLAAETAEIVFTGALNMKAAQEYYRDIKDRMSKYGRAPDSLKVLPGLNAIVAATESEAREKHDYLQSMIQPLVGKSILSTILGGIDLSSCDENGPLPKDAGKKLPIGSVGSNAVALAEREKLTVKQLYLRLAGARGKLTIVGSVNQIADQLEDWFLNGGADGFILQPAYLPGALTEFTRLVVPELRRRGLFRSKYEGQTLRENLGLARPTSRYGATKIDLYRSGAGG
jgi:FMN-dependent oxidoreductase (nitrilotriacetate monooxygenase family)